MLKNPRFVPFVDYYISGPHRDQIGHLCSVEKKGLWLEFSHLDIFIHRIYLKTTGIVFVTTLLDYNNRYFTSICFVTIVLGITTKDLIFVTIVLGITTKDLIFVTIVLGITTGAASPSHVIYHQQ